MGKMYKIKYCYQTGDSFSNEDCESILEYEFESLEFAKESLKRIKQHYEWYTEKNDCYRENPKDKVKKPSWYTADTGEYGYDACINIRLNETTEVIFSCPWCGYFERLYGAVEEF